jgi:hypothetical protein
VSWTWQKRWCFDRGAGAVAEVLFHLITKDNECAADKSSNAIWVTTRTSAVDEVAQFENGRNVTTESGRIEGETFEVGCEVSETMDAGPTLTGSLALHVTDHSSRLSQWAMRARKEDDDPGAQ